MRGGCLFEEPHSTNSATPDRSLILTHTLKTTSKTMFCFGGKSTKHLAIAAAKKIQPATARRTFSAKKISVERFEHLFSHHDAPVKLEIYEVLDRSRICVSYEGKKYYGCTFTRLDSDYEPGTTVIRTFHLLAFEKATAEKKTRLLFDSLWGFYSEGKAEYALKYMIEGTERQEEAEEAGDAGDDDHSS